MTSQPVRVADGLWRLALPMRSDPGHINSWLLEDGDGWLVVDCGTRGESTRECWRTFMASSLYRDGITRIFLTHAHPDHAGSAPWLARETGAPVLMAAAERTALENFAVEDAQRDAEIADWMRGKGASPQQVTACQLFYQHFARGCPQIDTDIEIVAPGEVMLIGGRRWELHGGYGHTPCNLLMYQPEDSMIITGDQVLPEIVTHVGLWWRQSENPLPRYLESLQRLRHLPPNIAFPAHGDAFTGFSDRCDQLALIHDQRLQRIEKTLIKGALPLDEILRKFGGPVVDGPLFPLVAGQIYARLMHLAERDRVTLEADADTGVVCRRLISPAR